MPISTTLRALDGGIYINADGLRTDSQGNPITAEYAQIQVTTSGASPEGVVSAAQGVFLYDSVASALWIKSTAGTGTTGWTQLI